MLHDFAAKRAYRPVGLEVLVSGSDPSAGSSAALKAKPAIESSSSGIRGLCANFRYCFSLRASCAIILNHAGVAKW